MIDPDHEQELEVLLDRSGTHVDGDTEHVSERAGRIADISSPALSQLHDSNFTVPRKPVPGPVTASASVANATSNLDQAPVKSASKSNGLLSAWWWEVAACMIAIAALVAVALTLAVCQGRPLPNLPFKISINALVSVYTVIVKASLASIIATGLAQLTWKWFESDRPLRDLVTFDEARYDTFGALFLIWRVNFHQVVVLLGAVLALVSLGIDPFTQQLIHYVGCNETLADQTFTVPRTNVYQSTGAHTGAGTAAMPPNIQASVNAGIFAGVLPVGVNCETGNCTTTHEYGSVGYCTSCEDITHLMQFETRCANETVDVDTTKCPDNSTYPVFISSLPNGLSTSQGAGPDVPLMRIATISYGILQILMGKSSFSTSRTDPFTAANITGCDDAVTNDTWRCRQYGAVQCDLSPCVRMYQADVMAGSLRERQTAQTPQDLEWGLPVAVNGSVSSAAYVQSVLDLDCINDEQHSRILEDGYNTSGDQRWLSYNISFSPYDSLDPTVAYPQSLLASKCLYVIDEVFVNSLWSEYLYWFLNGTVIGEWGEGTLALLNGPQMLQTIYNYGQVDFDRINGIFNNVSLSMTNTIRQNGNDNHSAPAEGDVSHYAICLEVKWGWIAFPATLVLFTLIFCALVIFTTRRSEIWKSSPLAMVYRGPYTSVDQTTSVGLDPSRKIDGMESAARNLVVRMDKKEGRLKIS